MPIYVYRCQNCAHEVERIQKFSDPPLETCSECGGPMEKVLFPPGLSFKGSGWYVTDYARKEQNRGPAKNTDRADGEESGADRAGGE